MYENHYLSMLYVTLEKRASGTENYLRARPFGDPSHSHWQFVRPRLAAKQRIM